MDAAMLFLRLLHIVLGVYWAGTIIFTALYLEPSVRAVGPPGGQVMTQLIRRGHLNVMPAVALITILTGIDLYRRVSGGFQMAWITSARGMALMIGAVAAIVAFVIGVFVMRATSLRIVALSESTQQVPQGPEREGKLAEIQPLRRRVTLSVRWVAALLFVTVATMAIAQYL
jgi:hypothetical protein